MNVDVIIYFLNHFFEENLLLLNSNYCLVCFRHVQTYQERSCYLLPKLC